MKTRLPINITGGNYQHQSDYLSIQKTVNLYPELINNEAVNDKYILRNWIGLSSVVTLNGSGQGMLVHKNELYAINGQALVKINSDYTTTILGNITSTGICEFASIGDNIVVATASGNVWVYNGSTFSRVTDTDLLTCDSIAYLKNKIIFKQPNGQFSISDVGDPTSIDALNFATAEAYADNIVKVYTWNDRLIIFGDGSIEVWWNSGVGNPPFDLLEGSVLKKGLYAKNSVASTDNLIYFLGSDNIVYAYNGSAIQAISNAPMTREIEEFNIKSDAIAWVMNINDRNFYVLTFPSANKTYVYCEGFEWFNWESGLNGDRCRGISHVYVYDKHFIQDHTTGDIYHASFDYLTDNGDLILKSRTTGTLSALNVGVGGKFATLNRFQLDCQMGVGGISGDNPQIMLQFTDNGGDSWSTERRGFMGELNNNQNFIAWNNLGRFYRRSFKISITDSVQVVLHRCYADIEVGI